MRQVFTSTRLENVEGVERMLNEAGIATKITQGRSWKGTSRREFSYSAKDHDPSQQPALWVLRPDDFKRAREILHEAGLLAGTREASYLPENLQIASAKIENGKVVMEKPAIAGRNEDGISYSMRAGSTVNPSEVDPVQLYRRLFGAEFQDPNKADFTPDPAVMLRQSVLNIRSQGIWVPAFKQTAAL